MIHSITANNLATTSISFNLLCLKNMCRCLSSNRFKTSDYMQGIVGSYHPIISSIFRGRNFDYPKSTESAYIPRMLYGVFFRYRSLKEVRERCLVEKRKAPKESVSILTAHPTVLAYLTAHLPTD